MPCGIELISVLTQETVIAYLLRRGHLTPEELIANGVKVYDSSRRNGNFRVERQSGDWLLLKQAREPNALQTVAWEAMIYRAFQALPASHPLRRYTVPFLEYDADEAVLFLRSIADARTLAAHQNQGRISTGPATWMGRALAALHSLELGSSAMRALSEGLPRRVPHALFLHRPDHALYCNASYGNLQAVRILQSFPAFGALIDALTKEWRPSCLVHFDVKGDNILLLRRTARALGLAHRLGTGCAWRSGMGCRLHVRRLSRRVAVVDPDHWGTPAGPLPLARTLPIDQVAVPRFAAFGNRIGWPEASPAAPRRRFCCPRRVTARSASFKGSMSRPAKPLNCSPTRFASSIELEYPPRAGIGMRASARARTHPAGSIVESLSLPIKSCAAAYRLFERHPIHLVRDRFGSARLSGPAGPYSRDSPELPSSPTSANAL